MQANLIEQALGHLTPGEAQYAHDLSNYPLLGGDGNLHICLTLAQALGSGVRWYEGRLVHLAGVRMPEGISRRWCVSCIAGACIAALRAPGRRLSRSARPSVKLDTQ